MNNNIEEKLVPLSTSQLGVYLECLQEPDSVKYNTAFYIRLPENIDIDRLKEAVMTVGELHPVFGIKVVNNSDGIPCMKQTGRSVIIRESEAESISALSDFVKPFDVTSDCLYRIIIVHTPEGDCLFYDANHIISDGTSVKVFISQIADAYNGKELLPEKVTLMEYAEKEADYLRSSEYDEVREYFRSRFEGIDADSLPVPDHVESDDAAGSSSYIFTTDGSLSVEETVSFAKSAGVSENTVFMTAFAYTLAKFSGMQESLFCTASAGRYKKDLDRTLGMFIRLLPVHLTFDEKADIREYLAETQREFYETLRHDSISFAELADNYGITSRLSFVFHGGLFDGGEFDGVPFNDEYIALPDSEADFQLMIIRRDKCYELIFNYQTALYTDGLVRDFAEMYLCVLKSMLKAASFSEIQFVSSCERQLLDGFNETEYRYDDTVTVVDLFRRQAEKTPDNICVVSDDRRYTYREIDRLTDNLAAYLIDSGICAEKKVGVLIPRCEYMPICSLGVLKSGGAYLPLDPTYPPERLNLMMQDSGAEILITTPELNSIIDDSFSGLRLMTDDIPKLEECRTELPSPSPHDLFVMLYTSGSTGVPKGVMFEHSNTLVTTEWTRKYFGIDESSRVTAYASYGFDAHAFDMYPAIVSGAELHVISDDIRLDFPALRKYFNENGITHTVMTTQIGRQFALMGGLTTLRHLSVAGEKLTPLDVPDGLNVYNLYGPTEGSIVTSAFRIDRRYKDVPIGRPVDNLKMYVADSLGRLLPPGAAGELWISGPHVTRGYLNRPEKTAEAYGNNTFDDIAGYERIYRTGDIVRIMHDGNLQFIGRRDAQVKVRGFRIELTEVEEVIRRFDGIKDATVAAFDDPAGGKFIAAYVVSDEKISASELSDFIRSEKPPYMVPAVIMQIDRIPLNQNQKVNKRALPLPKREAGELVKPKNELQKSIFDVVSDILGHSDFGITTDLYEAGLTSIGAVRLNAALAGAFDVSVRISDIKENSTVEKLERFINSSAPQNEYELQADYPITQTQNGIFMECIAEPESTAYNIPLLVKIGSSIDLQRLASAVKAAIDAHPYVKTLLFTSEDGSIRAKRCDGEHIEVPVVKCEKLPEKLVKPFMLIQMPLFRTAIYETDDGNYLFMDFHHIICDGTSDLILFKDIERAYSGEVPEPEKFSGFEAGLAEEEVRSSSAYDEAKAYWAGLLADAETNSIPKSCPETQDGSAGTIRRRSRLSADKVTAYCEENSLSMNAFFNSAFSFVLSRFTGTDSVTYATVYNGRSDSRLAGAVSMLVKTFPVAAEITAGECTDFVRSMQSQLIDSMANDAYSFAEIAGEHGVNADIMFVYQGDSFNFDSLCGETAELISISGETAKAPLSVTVGIADGHFDITAEYRRDTYSEAFAAAFAEALEQAASQLTDCGRTEEISLLTESGEEAYSRLNDTYCETEKVCCHELVERYAASQPDADAVVTADDSITFGKLNENANRIAHSLAELGLETDSIVGLVLERTKEVYITQIGIMKAGGAFLPMIPSYPDERIDYCLTNADSPYVITTEKIKSERAELFSDDKSYRTLTLEELFRCEKTDDLCLDTDLDSLAYCIYTSGSTGTPKGVMITHRCFSNFVQANVKDLEYYRGGYSGTCLATSAITFDMSLVESQIALANGKCVCMATEEEFHNPMMLMELMKKHNVQMITGTPSFLSNIVGFKEFAPILGSLVTLISGGEAFPPALYDSLRRAAPQLQIINGYGPTECTVYCTYKELTGGKGITIGGPTPNVSLYVCDKFGNILPPFGTGELLISGAMVGRGYVKLPEKTAASFVMLRGKRAYHSGDVVRLNGSNEIEFSGRIDNQVKLRGFRIELDEIEKVMLSYKGVQQCKVLVRNNGSEDYLAAFFTAEDKVDTDALTAYIKTKLTYYMVPAVMMQLDTMPLTPNGKIDKKAFPEVQKTSAARQGSRRAAKKSLEQRLCEMFANTLGLDEVYADDNFFELGGTSLTASKITMQLMSDSIDVKYGDIFDNPTPEMLAVFIESRDKKAVSAKTAEIPENADITREALKYNMVRYAKEVKREELGDVLLTGAVGFLGIHVLRELITGENGRIICLVRHGSYDTPLARLKSMLIYYFSDSFEDALRDRITIVEADITDDSLSDSLSGMNIDTVINCAACVKHFSDDDTLNHINVHGVERLIELCREKDARLVQISTTSVPGIHTEESYEKQVRMHENELFSIDSMDNKYVISKYQAELRVFDAVESGLRAKVIRVGNLMGRHSDGEFQANMETNMFLSGIRGFAFMGKYPISHMTDPMSFSPIDCTAKAVVTLAGTNDKFTAFNCDNRYGFDEMKIIDACNRCGLTIVPTDDDEYYEEFRRKLGDERYNSKLNGLAAYDIQDAHFVETDNRFTTNILYRLGFSWPLVDDVYLEKTIRAIMELDYFGTEELEDTDV